MKGAGESLEKIAGPAGAIMEVGGMITGTIDKFTTGKSCWLKTKGRGWGHPINGCPEDKKKMLSCATHVANMVIQVQDPSVGKTARKTFLTC